MNVEIKSKWMSVEELRAGIGGTVYLPGDPGYDDARQAWNLVVEQEPQVIVDAETAVDVQLAVQFARSNGLPIGVMATGHGMPRGCDGVLIRTAQMRGVKIDPETRMAKVQGGALVKDVLLAGQEPGLAMLSGSTTAVGVVGYTLGGGFGLMVRKHGLAIDYVRSARIVTPEGRLISVSHNENADIFWAIRGGGGAFGVIVEMTIELVPQATIFGGAVAYPAEGAAEILRAYADWTAAQSEEITSTLMLMNLPPLPMIPEPLRGKAVVMINACVAGDLSDAVALVQPLRELGTPMIDAWGVMPYSASDRIYEDPTHPMPSCCQGAMLNDLSSSTLDRMLEGIGPVAEMPQLCIQIRHIGGAMARVAEGETPLGGIRKASYMMYTIGVPNPFATAAALYDHSNGIFEALGSAMMCRGPLNFLGEGNVKPSAVKGAYGAQEYLRLETVKRSIDPQNSFRYASLGLMDED